MRLKILLEPLTQKNLIPINYQYQLSCAVYNVMRNGSEEYANWLHEVGNILQNSISPPTSHFFSLNLQVGNINKL